LHPEKKSKAVQAAAVIGCIAGRVLSFNLSIRGRQLQGATGDTDDARQPAEAIKDLAQHCAADEPAGEVGGQIDAAGSAPAKQVPIPT